MRRGIAIGMLVAALAAPLATAGTQPAWRSAGDVQRSLSEAATALILEDRGSAMTSLGSAEAGLAALLADDPAGLARVQRMLGDAHRAIEHGDGPRLAAARAAISTAVLAASFRHAVAATKAGDVAGARSWLLVREFRPPTRFSRASIDATVALDRLAAGSLTRASAVRAVRNDLLDAYDDRLQTALASTREASRAGLAARRAEAGALAAGYWTIVRGSFAAQRGSAAAVRADQVFQRLARTSLAGATGDHPTALAAAESVVESFRAAPLSADELLRRAGQVKRFLELVPIEYGRGVSDGRVRLDFEIQEAITFRDGAAAAFHDLAPTLFQRSRPATRRVEALIAHLGVDLAQASDGSAVADPDAVSARTDEALTTLDHLYPAAWSKAAETADFDVIAATLDRLQGAAVAGDWAAAETARLEAYGIFELGPEQRLRGIAPDLFREVEGYFWYGGGGHDGLVRLIKRKAAVESLDETRAALDDALARAEERIGAGPASTESVITNSAIIVFREGLEAVLILAALMASMVGAQRTYRRPLLFGVGIALAASVVTWVVAQTVLTSLARYGEKLEAIVSLVAIGVLLLILNWFYHRVYWQENLQGLHRRKSRILAGAGISLAAAQMIGLVALGFSSVYREGFETVLFLQALTLEASPMPVLVGVALGFAATLAVFFLVVGLEHKLPHKTMLKVTGLLITWVLVVMVGTTVQTFQKVGWLPVSPIEGLELPYWSGVWLGLFPTWEGILAQVAAAVLVLGSYFGAEQLRARRRARILAPARAPSS